MPVSIDDPRVEVLFATPEIAALAPLIYVVWSDGILTDDEVRAIREVARSPSLDGAAASALSLWLDPGSPPQAAVLDAVARRIRKTFDGAPPPEAGLAALGLSLARLQFDDCETNADFQSMLCLFESATGVVASDAVRAIFHERTEAVRDDFDEPSPSFDPAALTPLLDAPYSEAWDRVRSLLQEPGFEYRYEDSKEVYRDRVLGWVQRIVDAGLTQGAYAPSPDGDEHPAGIGGFIATFEALGMFDLSLVVKFGVQFGLFGGAIYFLGTEDHRERLLPKVLDGSLLGGFAMTELGHGSNVRQIETTAVFDPTDGSFVLHTPSTSARKEWIGNAAAHGRAMVVFTQLIVDEVNHGVHALYVPVRDEDGALLPGIHIEDCGHKMGLNGVDNGRIWFDHVRVPRSALLNRYGDVSADGVYTSPIPSASRRFFTMLSALVAGRVSVAAASVTASKSALRIAVRYGALRRQFGPTGQPEMSILDYRALQLRLMPRLAATYAMHFAVRRLMEDYAGHRGDDMREVETLAAAIKAGATWEALDTVQACRECCGGMAFLTVNRISEIRKDIDVFATFEGDNTVLMGLVAKGLLSQYQQTFKEDAVYAVLRQIRRRAAVELLERNPVTARLTGRDHLTSPDVHRDAFAFREHNLLVSAARRLRKRIDAGMDAFIAFNEVQDHLLALAHAHVDSVVTQTFAAAVESCDDPRARVALQAAYNLDAVGRLARDIGWFLENRYIEPVKARAIRKLNVELCAELRVHALPLVDAFGIPDVCLAAPIAFEGYIESASLARRS